MFFQQKRKFSFFSSLKYCLSIDSDVITKLIFQVTNQLLNVLSVMAICEPNFVLLSKVHLELTPVIIWNLLNQYLWEYNEVLTLSEQKYWLFYSKSIFLFHTYKKLTKCSQKIKLGLMLKTWIGKDNSKFWQIIS